MDDRQTVCGNFTVKVLGERALLLSDVHGDDYWIPKAQICAESMLCSHSEAGDFGELILPEWLAEKKGLSIPEGYGLRSQPTVCEPCVGETVAELRERGWIVLAEIPDHAVMIEARLARQSKHGVIRNGPFEWAAV